MSEGAIVQYRAIMPVATVGEAVARRAQMVSLVKSEAWVPGVDSGVIPGTDKEVLLLPGAQKLAFFFGLVPQYEALEEVADWTGERHGGEPFFYFRYKCRLLRNGELAGEGIGSANSREPRYRYRWVPEHEVPAGLDKKALLKHVGAMEEFDFAIEKGETTGQYGKPAEYWEAFHEAIKNGTAIRIEKRTKSGRTYPAWRIETAVYRVPNPDIEGLVNTIDKIAQKRAFVAAIISATAASEFFTQDLDDVDIPIDSNMEARDVAHVPQETAQPARRTVLQETAQSARQEQAHKNVAEGGDEEAPTGWDWNALFKPLNSVGLRQADVLKEFGVKSTHELRSNFDWEDVLRVRDILVGAASLGLSLDSVHGVLGEPATCLFEGTTEQAMGLLREYAKGGYDKDVPF